MTFAGKRWVYAAWLLLIAAFAAMHFVHLRADFPNHSPWMDDFAKYTDEGWYSNAAVRQTLHGNWYVDGDFNPAAALPVWPLLEWVLFAFTGVSIEAARALAVGVFCVDLLLAYLLVRTHGARWSALLGVTLAVLSPMLYAFSRLATLEPLIICFTLAAMNVAVRLPRMRRPLLGASAVGVLFTLMLLTKTSAAFLLPAVLYAVVVPLWGNRRLGLRCTMAAGASAAVTLGAWMALIVHAGLLRDFRYLFFVNHYPKPGEWYWPIVSLWWSLHGAIWGDKILIPMAGAVCVLALIAWRWIGARKLRANPVFGATVVAAMGYVLFMTYQDHPQPRYYTVVLFFGVIAVATAVEQLVKSAPRGAAVFAMGLCVMAAAYDGFSTLNYVSHPEYTWVQAAQQLTNYIDTHPNGNRMLVSVSADQIALMTHLPGLCDDFGTEDLPQKLAQYQPGWWATWNDIDPGTLEDLHVGHSLEQVATFRALDHPERNVLVLFKLHPLPQGKQRDPDLQNLMVPLPGDKIEIAVE